MANTNKTAALRDLALQGIQLLQEEKWYTQKTLFEKLQALGFKASTASVNKLLLGKPVGILTLRQIQLGVQEIIRRELGMHYDAGLQAYVAGADPNWEPEPVQPKSGIGRGITFHADGRLSLQYKTAFIAEARERVIELGLQLKGLTTYFSGQNYRAYQDHVVRLLHKGVQLHNYLLEPECREAAVYLSDLALEMPDAADGIQELKRICEKFRRIRADLAARQLPGEYQVWAYRHVPCGWFLVVDGHLPGGKMLVSPYLYGVSRADCPVIEIHKREQPALFRVYWKALQGMMRGANAL
jgi:hypothetical protein